MVMERGQLPIADSHDEILDAIQKNQVVLIRGETGSGKTTQVSAVCLTRPPRLYCVTERPCDVLRTVTQLTASQNYTGFIKCRC